MTKEQIKSAAMELGPIEREALAEELLQSLTIAERESIDQAWLAEAHRRDARFRTGQTSTKPVDEVIQRLKPGNRP